MRPCAFILPRPSFSVVSAVIRMYLKRRKPRLHGGEQGDLFPSVLSPGVLTCPPVLGTKTRHEPRGPQFASGGVFQDLFVNGKKSPWGSPLGHSVPQDTGGEDG